MKKIISIFLMILGMILLLEGKISISTSRLNNIDELLPEYIYDVDYELLSSTQKDYVLINLYRTRDKIYVVEYTKNLLFDLYSLSEITGYDYETQINSVVSSSIYHYSYGVNVEEKKIEIYDEVLNNNVFHSIFIIIVGGILFIKDDKKTISFN